MPVYPVPPFDKQCVAEVCVTAGGESPLTIPPLDMQCVAEVCVAAGAESALTIPPLDKQYIYAGIETA